LLGEGADQPVLLRSMNFFSSLADSLDPWQSGDLGCVAIRRQSHEDATGLTETPEEERGRRTIEQSEALISLIEAAISRREQLLLQQESYCLPASAGPSALTGVDRLLKARQTDVALAREEVDDVDLLADEVDMTDLLSVDEVETESIHHGSAVTMGSLLGRQPMPELQTYSKPVPAAARVKKSDSEEEVNLSDSDDEGAVKLAPYSYEAGGAAGAAAAEEGSEADTYEYSYESEAGDDGGGPVEEGPWASWASSYTAKRAQALKDYARMHGREGLPLKTTPAAVFSQQCLSTLEEGVSGVVYIEQKSGAATAMPKRLILSEDKTALSWLDPKDEASGADLTSGSLRLRDVKAVKLGPRTKAVAAAAQRKSWSCFAVETKQGAALDFGIPDLLHCEYVVCGLRMLIGDTQTRGDYLWKRTSLVVTESDAAPSFEASLKTLATAIRGKRG